MCGCQQAEVALPRGSHDGMPEIHQPVLFLKLEMIVVLPHARIDSYVKIEGGQGVIIGHYTHVSSFCHLNVGGGTLWIGDHVGIASGARIAGGSNQPDAISMSAASPAEMQLVARKKTVLGDYAFVGMNAVVMPGVTIGEGAVLGASAVATRDIPPWEIWAGVPARKIGQRVRFTDLPAAAA